MFNISDLYRANRTFHVISRQYSASVSRFFGFWLPMMVLLNLVLISCSGAEGDSGGLDESRQDGLSGCGVAETFVEDGVLTNQRVTEVSGDLHIANIEIVELEECEKVVITLDQTRSDGASGSSGSEEASGDREEVAEEESGDTIRISGDTIQIEVRRELGLIRIALPYLQANAEPTDAHFDGELVKSSFVVRPGRDSGQFVDLHMNRPSRVHAELIEQPARIVVTLRPGGSDLPEPASVSDQVVVTEPRTGETGRPQRVSGYSRTFESNVVLRVEQQGVEIYQTFTTAAGWLGAWGAFAFDLEEVWKLPEFDQDLPVTLHLGDYSAKDGIWEGVAVELNPHEVPDSDETDAGNDGGPAVSGGNRPDASGARSDASGARPDASGAGSDASDSDSGSGSGETVGTGSASGHGSAENETETELYRLAEPYGGQPVLVEALCSLPVTEGRSEEATEALDQPEGCVNISLLDGADRRELIAYIAGELNEWPTTEYEAFHSQLLGWIVAYRQLQILSYFVTTEALAAVLFSQPLTTELFDQVLSRRSIDRDSVDGEAVASIMSSAEHENLVREAATVIAGESRQDQMHVFMTVYNELE